MSIKCPNGKTLQFHFDLAIDLIYILPLWWLTEDILYWPCHLGCNVDRLQKYTGPELLELLKWPRPLPLEDERISLLHEVGLALEKNFGQKAANIVEFCGKSAATLVAINIARHFPDFRDHSVYKGHQVFLYIRAQIFAADLWGAFKGQGYGEFNNDKIWKAGSKVWNWIFGFGLLASSPHPYNIIGHSLYIIEGTIVQNISPLSWFISFIIEGTII